MILLRQKQPEKNFHKLLPPHLHTFWHRLCLTSCLQVSCLCFSVMTYRAMTTSALDPAPLPYCRTSFLQLFITPAPLIFPFSLDHFHCIRNITIFLIHKKSFLDLCPSSTGNFFFSAPPCSCLPLLFSHLPEF